MKGNKRKGRRPGTWELCVDAGADPLTLKRQQKSMTFHGTSREADVTLAELITKSSRGQVSVGQRTVAHAVEAGLRQAQLEGLEPTTMRGYRTSAECHVLPALGTRRLSHLTAEHLDRFYGALVERRLLALDRARLPHPVVPGPRPGEAVGMGGGQRRRDARPPRQRTSNLKSVPIDVARAMIAEAAKVSPTLAALIVLAADTGARRGGLCALRWRHPEEQGSTLRIEGAIGETNVVYETDTKAHQHRTVTLSSFALNWLLDHRDRHAKACASAASG